MIIKYDVKFFNLVLKIIYLNKILRLKDYWNFIIESTFTKI